MPIAPAGLRRMRELRNCHIKGNFVTETALSIGAVETKPEVSHRRVRGFSFKFTKIFRVSSRKICEQVILLRRIHQIAQFDEHIRDGEGGKHNADDI